MIKINYKESSLSNIQYKYIHNLNIITEETLKNHFF